MIIFLFTDKDYFIFFNDTDGTKVNTKVHSKYGIHKAIVYHKKVVV